MVGLRARGEGTRGRVHPPYTLRCPHPPTLSCCSNYGGRKTFYGQVVTLQTLHHNPGMKKILLEEGAGRVLVVDGRGSLKCALMGDAMTARAQAKGAAPPCTALRCSGNDCTCRRLWCPHVYPAFGSPTRPC